MKLIAAAEFRYGDKQLKPGDSFESVSDEDARVLKGVGKAKDAPVGQPQTMETRALKTDDAPGLLDTPQHSGRRYNRRDMRAKE